MFEGGGIKCLGERGGWWVNGRRKGERWGVGWWG